MATARNQHAAGTPTRMTRFDDIYSRPDPRPYFSTLGALGYQTPHHAQGVFRRLLPLVGLPEVPECPADQDGGPRATVLDICCSYGINAALLNHHVTLEELYDRYTSPQVTRLTTAELIESDRRYFAACRRPDAVPVIGLDIAAPAMAYGRAVGLLDAGFAENLEAVQPSPALCRATRGTRLITVTGGASFLSARTFRPLLEGRREPPWVAAFVLRTGSYQNIADALALLGLTTEKDTARTYPQRRFTDVDEQRYAIAAVSAAGDDPRGKETDGHFHTALHLTRPCADAAARPLNELLRDA
ncbi:hypothetical protein J2Z21_008277 [Streptomyces griseochromogenes]|uniref:Methyltransferase type 12 n=1 Tax=Streptomyces griseochromogenes TaxID=68214 RepID=A0A1B1B0K6_9ACTN|nr:hypothetical protein [Streptomyces griseochromogenes]ANP52366.1 hypothetical protein AVL59_25030 [Streptomyces griseochromogenes]MBP2055263.1 hypothetical protein [Streptomyces griseochromogenes]